MTQPRFNYTGHGQEGKEYKKTADLDIAEIAKLIRREIKEKYPQIGTSVRIRRFAGGHAIDCKVKETPHELFSSAAKLYLQTNPNLTFDAWTKEGGHVDAAPRGWFGTTLAQPEYYTKEIRELLADIKKFGDQYNFNDSDAQIDYFHNRFFWHVEVDYQWETREKKKVQQGAS